MGFEIRQAAHGSAAWRETVALRDAVLRAPLGLAFTDDELAHEVAQLHLALYWEGALAGVVVLVPPAPARPAWKLRQMAVAPAHRGRGLGRALVTAAEQAVCARFGAHVVLHARAEAVPFYARLDYAAEGCAFDELSIPHQLMSKRLLVALKAAREV